MEKYPLLQSGKAVGELTVVREGEDTVFSARCRLGEGGLWCLWAVGSTGELRLGVPERGRGEAVLSRRFSGRMTAPLGRISHGEVRNAAAPPRPQAWEEAPRPETLFRTPWLRRALNGRSGALTAPAGKGRLLALPFGAEDPFPLPSLFCLARVQTIRGRRYAVFAFDEKEWPVLR